VLNAVVQNTFSASGTYPIIHPSALPSGAGVNIFVAPHAEAWVSHTPPAAAAKAAASGTPQHSGHYEQALMMEYNLVRTSQQGTG
jgi:hypothetical protein